MTKKLAKEANIKYKTFLQKLEDLYSYIDEQSVPLVASKILLYHRDLQIDKIAEIIGGKDERAKVRIYYLINYYYRKFSKLISRSSTTRNQTSKNL